VGTDPHPLLDALASHRSEGELRERLGERVAVSAAGDEVFLYADTEDAARQARQVVGEILDAHGVRADYALDRWHHAEEKWEDASVPLPTTPEQVAAEHAQLEREEADESRASGDAEWELRIEFASHHDAKAFAARLGQEGYGHIVRRFHFLLVGADDEDDANALAERLRGELPDGATLSVEPGSGLVWEAVGSSAFAVFGGLAG
jgi:hypothetical protein